MRCSNSAWHAMPMPAFANGPLHARRQNEHRSKDGEGQAEEYSCRRIGKGGPCRLPSDALSRDQKYSLDISTDDVFV
jgi:hypothetical protein